jgi:hypothetical protein
MTAVAFKARRSLLAFVLMCSPAVAQQALSADASPDLEGSGDVSMPITSERPQSAPERVSKRLFGILPNHRAEEFQAVYQPISTAEKFHIARSDSFDWPNYFLLAGFALQSQVAAGGFSHNGGFTGFTQYYARAFGDQISAAT